MADPGEGQSDISRGWMLYTLHIYQTGPNAVCLPACLSACLLSGASYRPHVAYNNTNRHAQSTA